MTRRGVELAVVTALFGPPAGRRGGWVAVVPRCPGCSAVHTHRARPEHDVAGEPLVRRCRTTGAEYQLTAATAAEVTL